MGFENHAARRLPCVAGALRLSRTAVWSSLANRPTAFDMLVLITDGVPSLRYEAAGLVAEANRIKAMDVRLVGIGVTTAVDADALKVNKRSKNFDSRPNRRQKLFCAAVKIVAKRSTTGCHDVNSGAEFFGNDAAFYQNFLQVTPVHRAFLPQKHPAITRHRAVTL